MYQIKSIRLEDLSLVKISRRGVFFSFPPPFLLIMRAPPFLLNRNPAPLPPPIHFFSQTLNNTLFSKDRYCTYCTVHTDHSFRNSSFPFCPRIGGGNGCRGWISVHNLISPVGVALPPLAGMGISSASIPIRSCPHIPKWLLYDC